MPMVVSLTSMVENLGESQQLNVFIIYDELAEVDFQSLLGFFTGQDINFCLIPVGKYKYLLKLDEPQKNKNSLTAHFRTSIFYRIYIPYLLPKSISKVIYLDADTIINANITSLWECDISDYKLAAVPEPSTLQEPIELRYKQRLDLGINSYYFNSGVLVMNLDLIRNSDLLVDAIYLNNTMKLNFPDQDILNAIFPDYLMLDPKFNSMWVQGNPIGIGYLKTLETIGRESPYNAEVVRRSINEPSIIHYLTSHKPWLFPGVFSLHKNTWWSYYNKTFYKSDESMSVLQILSKGLDTFIKENSTLSKGN